MQHDEYLSVHFICQVAMGYVSSGMGNCFDALFASLMALRLAPPRPKPLLALFIKKVIDWMVPESRR